MVVGLISFVNGIDLRCLRQLGAEIERVDLASGLDDE